MGELNLEQHHGWCREALSQLDVICKENNIPYFLIEGSCLGAVRHNNIIPWDDDIDVAIFLKDRDTISILLENNLTKDFQWVDRRIDENHPRFFGKILHNGQGCIDVFPLIKTSNSNLSRRLHWLDRKVFNKLYKAKLNYANQVELKDIKGKVKTRIVKIISLMFSKAYVVQRMSRIENRYENIVDCEYFFNLYGSYKMQRELIKSDWIGQGSLMKFGNDEYPIFHHYHDYLTNLYGDYMTPPPVNQRARHHEETF